MPSPFTAPPSSPGTGAVRLSLRPPGQQVLSTLRYQYPLKLVAPDPHRAGDGTPVTVVFLLTYGGGLVGGDAIRLAIDLDAHTKLVLVTQGSTKLFKCASPTDKSTTTTTTTTITTATTATTTTTTSSSQLLQVGIGAGAALCYLPDPTQPFAQSAYAQRQTFCVDASGTSSLLLLDWVSEGRPARGERWQLREWSGRNEVRLADGKGAGRLLLRDALTLSNGEDERLGLAQKTDGMGVFGTLIIYGPVFATLGAFFIRHMADQPRIGMKNFAGQQQQQQQQQQEPEQDDGLLWTAAHVRGFVLVKFGARSVDGARQWLARLLRAEGTVERQFGHQALLCLR